MKFKCVWLAVMLALVIAVPAFAMTYSDAGFEISTTPEAATEGQPQGFETTVVIKNREISVPFPKAGKFAGTNETIVASGGNLEGRPSFSMTQQGFPVFKFRNLHKEKIIVVLNAAVNDQRGANSQWLVLPWGNKITFLLPNKEHPNGVAPVAIFGLEGDRIFTLTEAEVASAYPGAKLAQGGGPPVDLKTMLEMK